MRKEWYGGDRALEIMVKGLVSNLETYHPTVHFTPWSWTCSFMCLFNSPGSTQPAALSALGSFSIHLCPTRYWFTWRSEARENALPKNTTSKPCPNVERGETYLPRSFWHSDALMSPVSETIIIIILNFSCLLYSPTPHSSIRMFKAQLDVQWCPCK